MYDARALAARFEEIYGRPPAISRAPGRVNLIGEHTDYNQGFVMPAALEFATLTAAAPPRRQNPPRLFARFRRELRVRPRRRSAATARANGATMSSASRSN